MKTIRWLAVSRGVLLSCLIWCWLAAGNCSAQNISPTAFYYSSWSFNTTNWLVDPNIDSGIAFPPLSFTNLTLLTSGWDGNALWLDSSNPAVLTYNPVETNGQVNFTPSVGIFDVFFSPDWNSGTGPGNEGRIIDAGTYTSGATIGWWSLYFNATGTSITFAGQTNNGNGATYLSAPISWTTNSWHLIGLMYTSSNSLLSIDGVVVTNGTGVTYWPGPGVMTNGFCIGSDSTGVYQAKGVFEDAESFNWIMDPSYFTEYYDAEAPIISAWEGDGGGSRPDGLINPTEFNTTDCITGGQVYFSGIASVATNNGTVDVTLTVAGGSSNVDYTIYSTTNLSIPISSWTLVTTSAVPCTPLTVTNQSTNDTFYVLKAPTISNLVVWLRADVGVTPDVNGNVFTWHDQSGTNNDFGQFVTTNRPAFITNQLNGLPVVRFYGASTFLTNVSNVLTGAANAEIFALIKAQTNNPAKANQALWSLGGISSGSGGLAYPYVNGVIDDDFGSANQYNMGIPAQPITEYHIYHACSATNNWFATINGNFQYASAPNTVSFTGSRVLGAAAVSASTNFAGDIVEMMAYNRVLTGDERDRAEAYLSTKYGMLPAAPPTPGNLAATAISSNQISLTWTDTFSNFKTEFIIARSTSSASGYRQVGEVDNGLSFVDSGLAASTTYYYKIFAANYSDDSPDFSNVTNATTSASGVSMPLTNLVFWLKADTGAVYDSSNYVGSWIDQTTNGNNASTTTLSQRPTWEPNQQNGLPSIYFTNDQLYLPYMLKSSTQTQAEIFAVVKAKTPTSNSQGLWSFGSANTAIATFPNESGDIWDTFGWKGSVFEVVPSSSIHLTNYTIYNVSANSGTNTVNINGIQQTNTVNTNGFSFPQTISPILGTCNGGTGQFFNGYMTEILLFNRVLTTNEEATVKNYLSTKYNLGY